MQNNIKIGYCPICDEKMEFETEQLYANCYYCGHHLALSPIGTTLEPKATDSTILDI